MPNEDQLPPRLARELARLHRPEIPVPPEFDATVLLAARRAMARAQHRRRIRAWSAAIGGLAAAAAGLLLALHIFQPSPRFVLGPPPAAHVRPDILDAYRLARALQTGQKPPSQWDHNGDGHVDQQDVDSLARAAVALDDSATGGTTVERQ